MLVLTASIWFNIRVNIFIYDIYKIIRLITSTTFWPPSWTPSWPLVTWLSGWPGWPGWPGCVSTLRIFWSALHTSPDTGSVVKPFLYINTAPLSQIPSPTTRQLVNISPNPPGPVSQWLTSNCPKCPQGVSIVSTMPSYRTPLPTCHLADWPPNLSQTQLAPVTLLFTQLVATFF